MSLNIFNRDVPKVYRNNRIYGKAVAGGTGGNDIDLSNFLKLAGMLSQTVEGDLVLSGNLYAQGDVVAFSSVPGVTASWWASMPVASGTILGGIKLGANLTYNAATGQVDAQAGGVSSWYDLEDKPATFTPSAHIHNYNDLSNRPILFSGDYNALYNKPALFSGNYNDLTNKPDFSNYWTSNTLIANDIEATSISINGNEIFHQGNFNPSNYLPLAGGTLTGDLATASLWTGTDGGGVYVEGKSATGIRIQYNKGAGVYNSLKITDSLTFNNNTVWHAGNLNPSTKSDIGHEHNYIRGTYNSGGSELPSYFGGNIFKPQMLYTDWGWSDTLWIDTYGYYDVKRSNQLVFSKNGANVGFRQQNYDASSWGAMYEFFHTGNLNRSDTDFTSKNIYANEIHHNNGNGSIRLYGNLHIDSYNGNDIYLNYYSNRGIEIHGNTSFNGRSVTGIGYLNASYFRFGDGNQHLYQFGTDSASPAGMYLYDVNRGAYVFRVNDSNGAVHFNNEIQSVGNNAAIYFQNRSGANKYAWYAENDIVRLYNNAVGDILEVNSTGSLYTNGWIVSRYGAVIAQDNGNGYLELNTSLGSLPGYTNPFPVLKSNSTIYISAGNYYTAYFQNKNFHCHGNITASEGFSTEGGIGAVGNINTDNSVNAYYFGVKAGDGYGLRFWNNSDSYKIFMSSAGGSGYSSIDTASNDYNFYYKIHGVNRGHSFVTGNGTVQLHVTNNGIFAKNNITAGGEVTAYSDRSLKTDLKPLTNVLDKISNINGYYYKRVDLEDKNKTHLGLIAQEVEQHFPELVEQNKEGIKSLNYQNFVAVLLQGMKEQQAKIEDLESRINKK